MGIHPSSTATAVIDTTYVFRKHSKYTEKMDVALKNQAYAVSALNLQSF